MAPKTQMGMPTSSCKAQQRYAACNCLLAPASQHQLKPRVCAHIREHKQNSLAIPQGQQEENHTAAKHCKVGRHPHPKQQINLKRQNTKARAIPSNFGAVTSAQHSPAVDLDRFQISIFMDSCFKGSKHKKRQGKSFFARHSQS